MMTYRILRPKVTSEGLYIFRNDGLRDDIAHRYRAKAKRDWDEMQTIRRNIDIGKRPRKKYRNSNFFADMRLGVSLSYRRRTCR